MPATVKFELVDVWFTRTRTIIDREWRKNIQKNCLLLFLEVLSFLWSSVSFAQQNINFTHLGSSDGLSSNTVNAILKDKHGLMWFATEDGLNKFDGTAVTVYRYKLLQPNSLKANEILSLYEDKDGRLWVGTGGGSLSLYDRTHDNFINFPASNNGNAIRNSVIRTISSDPMGRIWIGTHAGINILDPATNRISELYLSRQSPLSTPVNCIRQAKNGTMWIGTSDGLYIIDPKTNKARHYYQYAARPFDLPNNLVHTLLEDNEGNMWVGTHAGLLKKEPGNPQLSKIAGSPSATLNSEVILSLSTDDKDQLWIGSDAGVDRLHLKTGQVSHLTYQQRNLQGLGAGSVMSIFFDDQAICWIGTSKSGISKYDPNLTILNLVKSNSFDPDALPSSFVSSFEAEKDGRMYVGTENGGLCIFNPTNRSFQRIDIGRDTRNPKNSRTILSLKKTSLGNLLIGTYGDGLLEMNTSNHQYRQIAFNKNQLSANSNLIYAIAEDHNGNTWLGTNGDGLIQLDRNLEVINRYTPLPKDFKDRQLNMNGYIRDILEDGNGFIWFATHGGGIGRLKPANGELEVYNEVKSGLLINKVQSLLEDKNGNIWAGTFGGGLAMLDKATGRFVNYTEQEGLANNNIYKILQDSSGLLWLATNKGLCRFDPIKKTFSAYTTHNGVQAGNFLHGSGFITADGAIYFGGTEGFNYFYLADLKHNDKVPNVQFTELKIANQVVLPSSDGPISENISVAKSIDLQYKQNFALSFVGLNFSAPEQNHYAYKLEGVDKDWIELGTVNMVSYTNLSPGSYTLRVRASNNDGVWNMQGKAIRIQVPPPFWRTDLAFVFYFLLMLGALVLLRHKGIQKVKSKFVKEQERLQLEQERREAERIHELDLQKIKFLTNLSHEFRTPISLIMGPIDSMIQQHKVEQDFGQLHLIKRNARRLLNLVNQLLDFRKLEENELKLNLQPGDLVMFTREVSDSFRDLSERKKIDFKFSSCIAELHVKFDSDKLERILFNLLSNAFKFTLEGGKIKLAIDTVTSQSQNNKIAVNFSITDTGVGIPQEQQEKIFEHFYQANATPAILNQGTGIGLSITREFVRLQGGNIQVQSNNGQGTRFTIMLPFELIEGDSLIKEHSVSTALPIQSAPVENIKAENDEKASILLVEDDDDFRSYLNDILQPHYRIYEASNGKEGWQKALAQHPHVVVSDISMPYMDGIELCQKIKTDKRTQHIPVILLTALAGENNQLKGLEIGANDYITKPFNANVLTAKVKNLLVLNQHLKHTYSKQIKVMATEVDLVSDDEKLMQQIMQYLEENMTDKQLSVEALSREVGMSRSSLYSKMLELTGQTPVEYIRSIKLEKAIVLLEKTDMNISQIAYSVGFASPNYFAKSFKTKYNMLPSEYVQKLKKY